jgi:hypothetical protein
MMKIIEVGIICAQENFKIVAASHFDWFQTPTEVIKIIERIKEEFENFTCSQTWHSL